MKILDYGQIQKAHRTPQGFLRAYLRTAAFDRPMQYRNQDGSVRTEQISKADLFDPKSTDTMKGQIIVSPHTQDGQEPNSTNFRQSIVGTVTSQILVDDTFLGVTATIYDENLIRQIEAKQINQVSPGYSRNLENRDGSLWQTDRRYFENAIVPVARGGADVRIKDTVNGDYIHFNPEFIDEDLINYWARDSDRDETNNLVDRWLFGGDLSPPVVIIPATIPTTKDEMEFTRIIIGGIELNVDHNYSDAAKDLQIAFDKAKAVSEVAAKSVKDSAAIELKLQDAQKEIETLKAQVASTETAIKDGIAEQVKNLQAATADLGLFAATGIDTTLAKTCLDASDMVGLQKAIVVAKFPAKATVDTATAAILYDSIRDHAIDSLQKQKDMMGMGLSMQTTPMGYPGTIQMQTQPSFTMPAMIQQVGGGPTNATVAGMMGAEELAIANGSVGGFPHGLPPKSEAWSTAPK